MINIERIDFMFKKFIAYFLTSLLLLSVIPAFTVSAALNYDGSQSLSSYTSGHDITILSDGTGGKLVGDNVYKIYNAKNTTATSHQNGVTIIPSYFAALTDADKSSHYSMQFMLPDAASTVTTAGAYYVTNKISNKDYSQGTYLTINSGMQGATAGAEDFSVTTHRIENIEINKWYTLDVVFDDKGEGDIKYYINGQLCYTVTRTDGNKINGFFNRFRIGPGLGLRTLYLDNINVNVAAKPGDTTTFSAEASTPSKITSVGSAKIDETNKTVYINRMTAKQLADQIQTDGANDSVRIYNNDFTALVDDNANLTGENVIVIASKKGTSTEKAYNYYNIEVIDDIPGRGSNATDLVLESGTCSISNGNYGKQSSDSVYHLTVGKSISLSNTFVGTAAFAKDAATSVKFDLCRGESEQARIDIGYYTTDGTATYNINFNNDGSISKLQTGDPQDAYTKIKDGVVDDCRWYSIGVNIPNSKSPDAKLQLYVNGELVHEVDGDFCGMRRPYIKNSSYTGNDEVFIDNLEVKYDGTYFDHSTSVPAQLNTTDSINKNGKIAYLSTAEFSVADGANIHYFNSDWDELPSRDGASYVVTAAKDFYGVESIYKYYAIDEAASENILYAFTSDGVKMNVEGYSKNSSILYLANYDSDKCLESIEFIDIPSGWFEETDLNIADRIFLWSADDKITPFTKFENAITLK